MKIELLENVCECDADVDDVNALCSACKKSWDTRRFEEEADRLWAVEEQRYKYSEKQCDAPYALSCYGYIPPKRKGNSVDGFYWEYPAWWRSRCAM